MTTAARAAKILDDVQSLAQLEAFAADRFAAALTAADPTGLRPTGLPSTADGAPDETPGLLAAIDRFAEKAMRIRLHNLTDEIPAQLRNLVATTIVAYEDKIELLRGRVAAMLARQGGSGLTGQICDGAAKVLALRAELRRSVLRVQPAAPAPAPSEPEADEEVDAAARRFSLLELD